MFADDKEIYANPDLRAGEPPVKLSLSVAGAEQLRLVVDYGRNQDTGDRVITLGRIARLYRLLAPKPPEESRPAEAKPAPAPDAKPASGVQAVTPRRQGHPEAVRNETARGSPSQGTNGQRTTGQ